MQNAGYETSIDRVNYATKQNLGKGSKTCIYKINHKLEQFLNVLIGLGEGSKFCPKSREGAPAKTSKNQSSKMDFNYIWLCGPDKDNH